MDIPENKWFYFKHGKRASNIAELKTVLESISESEFKHHVNYDKNDFASWVEDVFEEKKLAKNMREVGDKEGIIVLLDDFLSQENEPPSSSLPPIRQESQEHAKRHYKKTSMADNKNIIIEPGKMLSEDEPSEKEKELSENDIKLLVDDAMQVFDTPKDDKADKIEIWHEEAKDDEGEKDESNGIAAADAEEGIDEEPDQEADEHVAEDEAKQGYRQKLVIEKPSLEKEKSSKKEEPHKFMVEEFLYGFILGLIFGLIMLGVILQLKIA